MRNWKWLVPMAFIAIGIAGCGEADGMRTELDVGDEGSSEAAALPLVVGYQLITDGISIQNSVTDKHWIFADWSGFAALAGSQRAFISSDPGGTGPIIVDNGLYVNGREIGGTFGGLFNDPRSHLGESAVVSYKSVEALDVTGDRRADGMWYIRLVDYGYTFAASRLYLVITQP